MKWVYCHDNRKLPKFNVPTVCILRKRKGSRIVGVKRICAVQQDIMTDAISWVCISGNEDVVQPYAYLETSDQQFDEQFFHNLAKLGELPA